MRYNPNRADLSSSRDVRAAIGLQVQAGDLTDAHHLDPFRQQVSLGADQVWDSEGLVTWQEVDMHLAVGLDLSVDALFDLGHNVHRQTLKLKILTRAARFHCTAGDM